ncbi:hypothetical protein JXC34_03740 [Candidatus Woesearchaeota archaeon]|nr:hypothetical protein [Candidatus Woesearchaeota archaeon]
MSRKYTASVKRMQAVQILLAVVCIAALMAYVFFLTRPSVTSFVIKDECGPIGGRISHSIDDQDVCNNACNAYCNSVDKKFQKGEFEERLNQCNRCECFCAE